jgi:membrane peptidoglycan carboxypeptidase
VELKELALLGVFRRTKVSAAAPSGESAQSGTLKPARKTSPALFVVAWNHLVLGSAAVALVVFLYEARTSFLQAEVFARYGQDLSFAVESGPASTPRYPQPAPHDSRLGYDRLGRTIERLDTLGYRVVSQARPSPGMAWLIDTTGIAPYPEKMQAGLRIIDSKGLPLFEARHPLQAYRSFDEIPPILIDTLLFIEDRALLSPAPRRNPAVDWRRAPTIAAALLNKAVNDDDGKLPGGSTLATQLEKFRHSPGGRTLDGREKLRQMLAASLRTYLDGPDTLAARKRIVVAYLNATPLAARSGFGEVNGLGDGLHVWYGSDFTRANRLLHALAPANGAVEDETGETARVYRQALSLLLAQRRPSYYLFAGRAALESLIDSYLRLLAKAGVITPALYESALAADTRFSPEPPAAPPPGKLATSLRADLMALLGESSLYPLDRLDLVARSSIDDELQAKVTETLKRIGDPDFVAANGLLGQRLLQRGDPGGVTYSVTLFERVAGRNVVRVQADNLDQPFDVNTGAKLDLGSTAKLRTLSAYLMVVAELHAEVSAAKPGDLAALAEGKLDPLSRWAIDYLARVEDRGLSAMLDAAMQRRYSASPYERFFTGGGMHRFVNFDPDDNGRVVTLAVAFRHSINLVFVRLMRDLVAYHARRANPAAAELLRDRDHPGRRAYLERFADMEGIVFLSRFYAHYAGKSPAEILTIAAGRARQRPRALTTVYRAVNPKASPAEFADWLRDRPAGAKLGEGRLPRLYADYAPEHWSLHDRGYIARLHPLELWLAGYLAANPTANLVQAIAASARERREAYAWLFQAKRVSAQNRRIRILLEIEAFELIHDLWQRLGYPFDSLVPSLGTAIGSSADRPEALAELMGIIVNGGLRLPMVRFERLHFAAGTPFETELATASAGERMMPAEVAARLRQALAEVVANGTARRAKAAFVSREGLPLEIGGKTGTGDHRFKQFIGERLVHSRVVSRNACFVFFLGDRYFGTIVAYVRGQEAESYQFTSSLPVQILTLLGPALAPLVTAPGAPPPDSVAGGSSMPPT